MTTSRENSSFELRASLPQTRSPAVGKGAEEGPRRTGAWSSDNKKKYPVLIYI